MALCLYTDRPDGFNPKKRHKGVGKRAAPEVLVLADLIDQTELDSAMAEIFAFQTRDGGDLAVKEQRGRWWFYRVTEAGIHQAEVWLADVTQVRELEKRIHEAIERRRDNKPEWGSRRVS
jgi:hypothetical protein